MTKLNRQLMAMLVVVLLSPLAARAASIKAQSMELGGSFTFQHTSASVDLPAGGTNDFGVTIFNLQTGLGYFFNPQWELLGNLVIDNTSYDDFSTSSFGLLGAARYHFATTGSIIPFAGIGIGFLANGGDSDDDATSFIIPQLEAGIRWPFQEIVSFNFNGGYRYRTNAYGVEDAGGHEFFLGAGIAVFLEGGSIQ